MKENGNKPECGFMTEIVSYIYDELAHAERRKFESHLGGCSVCTDEFAAISNARFSVFEWQKEEFANLRTPDFVIPYHEETGVTSPGWLVGLQRLFTFPVLSTAAAVMIVSLGIGFAVLNMQPSSEIVEVTVDDKTRPDLLPPSPEQPVAKADDRELKGSRSDNLKPSVDANEPRPVPVGARNVNVKRGSTTVSKRRSEQNAVPNIAQKAKPALTNYEEPVDRSLRLTDLVGDGGR